jgi:glycerol kinase
MDGYILSLDQGTTSSRAVVFDGKGIPVSMDTRPLTQIYPQPGWVEHDPEEIWSTQMEAAKRAIFEAGLEAEQIAGVGVTNQRETVVVWDKDTGKPLYNAIVWQCRRTAPDCVRLKEEGQQDFIRQRTGLTIDAYFSATKMSWLLKNVSGLKQKVADGKALFGTVDSWLLYNLTGGRKHATDYSNASRTMLFDIRKLRWDAELLKLFGIPRASLPRARASSGIFGETEKSLFGRAIPIGGVAGDQQAALFGQACYRPGTVKNTYGTGSFLLMNVGDCPPDVYPGLLTTIAWGVDKTVEYALEGSIFATGAAIQWLRDELGIIESADESMELAGSIEDTGGVYLVPAFVGLGSPYWDMEVRGAIFGLTRGTGRAHLVRAALEAMAYQTRDVLECMTECSGVKANELRVDGGAAVNDFLMQFQADILGAPVLRSTITESTSLGAAYLAGLATGYWENREQIMEHWKLDKKFRPRMKRREANSLYAGWKKAVEQTRGFS